MKRSVKYITANDLINYSSPIEVLPSIESDEFYDILKIVWKFSASTTNFDYSGKILFKIGDERICTLQSDSLSSTTSNAAVSNANICVDKDCPKITLGEPLKFVLDSTPPTQGNGMAQVDVYYYIDKIGLNWDNP